MTALVISTIIGIAASIGLQLWSDGRTVKEMTSNQDVTDKVMSLANSIITKIHSNSNKQQAIAYMRDGITRLIRGIASSNAINAELERVSSIQQTVMSEATKLNALYDKVINLASATASNPAVAGAAKAQQRQRDQQITKLGGLQDELEKLSKQR